ncbi:PAS domain-containing protein [Rhizobium sp. Root1204]|uniref:PAS domain-containing protein n=1 Tax=Rhizobium sp. Root1204 TaxID=1736428 RepID=UPI000A9B04A3
MVLEDLYRLLRSSHVQAQGVVDTMTQPVVVLDKNFNVTTANNAFVTMFEVNRDDVIGQSLFELGNGQWDVPELKHLIHAVIPKAAAVIGFEVKHDFPSVGQKTFTSTPAGLSTPTITAVAFSSFSTTLPSASFMTPSGNSSSRKRAIG